MSGATLPLFRGLEERLLERARARHPREACGLLFGRGERATRLVEVENLAAGMGRFEAHPGELRTALEEARARGERTLAAWHSHPDAAAVPGFLDSAGCWKELPVLVVAPCGRPRLRAWRRIEGGWLEVPLQMADCPSEEAPTPLPSRP